MYVSKCSSFDCMKRSKGSGRSVRKVTAAPPGMPPTSHRPPDISFVGCPVEIPNSPISSHLHNSTQQSSNYQGRAATNVLNASSFGHKHLQLAPNPFNSPFPDPKSQDESNTEHIYAEIKDVRKPVSEYCSTDLINTEPIYSNIPPTTSKPGYVPMLSPKVGVGSTAQNNDILSTKHEWGSIFRDSSLYKKLEKNIAGLKTEKHDTSAQSLAPSAPPAHLQPSQRPHIEIIKSDLIFSTNPMVKTLMK
ncbi:hypothetical protein LSTR_LSTR015854 [Laodelphax striatellus]|uniref:Uncharacterized protein n=1 Tax=Laodelphax striatellus TaxID=195883 RepID=A0A482XMP3_LAOST|nr:hypothetical protein LSTR_LSTR015854 [Laodelphax striatellus]